MSADLKNTIPEDKVKMYCVFALESIKKMNGNRGKMGTQSGHAYLHAYWDSEARHRVLAEEYRNGTHAFKITLVVDTVEELQALEQSYRDRCGVSLVTDAGFTVFAEPTTTCLGIGPIRDSMRDDDLANLATFK